MVRSEQGPAFGRIVWQRTYVRLTAAQLEALASDAPGAHVAPPEPDGTEAALPEDAAEHADSRTSESSSAPRALESRDGIKARLEADDRRKKNGRLTPMRYAAVSFW